MKTKRIAVAALICLLVAGCSGGKFAKEKTVMTTVTKALESLASAVGGAGAPEDFTKALGAFTGKLENVMPQMKELTDAHPDWENNPPEELKGTWDKFEAASKKFKEETVPKLMQAVSQNPDNAELQGAAEKFSQLVSQL